MTAPPPPARSPLARAVVLAVAVGAFVAVEAAVRAAGGRPSRCPDLAGGHPAEGPGASRSASDPRPLARHPSR